MKKNNMCRPECKHWRFQYSLMHPIEQWCSAYTPMQSCVAITYKFNETIDADGKIVKPSECVFELKEN